MSLYIYNYKDLTSEFVTKNSFGHTFAARKLNLNCHVYTQLHNNVIIASELYTVAILSFISAGRAKRERTSQHNVVRSKPTYPSSRLSILLGGNVGTECSKLETVRSAQECVYGTYDHMTGWNFQPSYIYGDIPVQGREPESVSGRTRVHDLINPQIYEDCLKSNRTIEVIIPFQPSSSYPLLVYVVIDHCFVECNTKVFNTGIAIYSNIRSAVMCRSPCWHMHCC